MKKYLIIFILLLPTVLFSQQCLWIQVKGENKSKCINIIGGLDGEITKVVEKKISFWGTIIPRTKNDELGYDKPRSASGTMRDYEGFLRALNIKTTFSKFDYLKGAYIIHQNNIPYYLRSFSFLKFKFNRKTKFAATLYEVYTKDNQMNLVIIDNVIQ